MCIRDRVWTGTSVRHLREYRKTDAEGSEIVLEPTEEPVRCIIFYRALVKVVELYVDGRMMQGDATALSKGGWTFKLEEGEKVRAIASATVLEHESIPVLENVREDYRRERLGIDPSAVRARLRQDERVFNIARPEELMEHPFSPQQQGPSRDATEPLQNEGTGGGGTPNRTASSFTYSQRKKMKLKEKSHGEHERTERRSLEPDSLDPTHAEGLRARSDSVPVKLSLIHI